MSASPSLAQSLYADGLHSIFKFLTFKQMPPIVRTCRSWRAAASKEKSRSVAVEMNPDRLALMATSPLRHHVSSLTVLAHSSVPFASIPALAALPHLIDLTLPIGPTENEANLPAAPGMSLPLPAPPTSESPAGASAAAATQKGEQLPAAPKQQPAVVSLPAVAAQWAAHWPPHLQRLTLRIQGFEPSVQLFIELASCLPTLEDLNVEAEANVSLDLSPLQKLPLLARLTVGKAIVIGETQIQHINSLESLRYLDVNFGKWSVEQLRLLGEPPSKLRLEELALGNTPLTPAYVAALSDLSALTCLHPSRVDPATLPLLCHFTALRSVHLRFLRADLTRSPAPQRLPLFLGCLEPLGAGLGHLTLESLCFDSEEQLAAFCALLPNLRSLLMRNVTLPTLLGFRSLSHLRELTFELCYSLQAEHLLELQHVPTLRSLTISLRYYNHLTTQLLDQAREVCRSPLLAHFTASIKKTHDQPQR